MINMTHARRRHTPERLLKWYDFKEIPDPMVPSSVIVATVMLPTPPATFGPEVSIPFYVKLKKIHSDDREELSTTIVWNFSLTTPETPTIVAVGSQKMQFSIWRDAPLTGTRICTVVDSGTMTQLTTSSPSVTFTNTITTSFQCTDTGISGRRRKYFLTAAAGVFSGFFVTDTGMPTAFSTFSNPTITEVHFSGSTIDENET
jgi:hypothetical protein